MPNNNNNNKCEKVKMLVLGSMKVLVVLTAVACGVGGSVRNSPRSLRGSIRNEASSGGGGGGGTGSSSASSGSFEFECPEEFGYYPHPRDCTQYYVCVFGGALLESCTGGLMYSHELQTCDWPRNVGCLSSKSISKETGQVDPLLLERAAKTDSIELEEEEEEEKERHDESNISRHRRPMQRQQHQTSSSSSLSTHHELSDSTESSIRQRTRERTYPDEEYEPASELENDRQQRVYRGQPSTIGQVQRDRDGLLLLRRNNIISVSDKPPSSSSSSSSTLPSLSWRSNASNLSVNIQAGIIKRPNSLRRNSEGGFESRSVIHDEPLWNSSHEDQQQQQHHQKDINNDENENNKGLVQEKKINSSIIIIQPRSMIRTTGIAKFEFEKNEISITTPISLARNQQRRRQPATNSRHSSLDGWTNKGSLVGSSSSSSSALKSSTDEELSIEKNDISGANQVEDGRGASAVIKQLLRIDRQEEIIPNLANEDRQVESISSNPSSFEPVKPVTGMTTSTAAAAKDGQKLLSFDDPENRKYYAVTSQLSSNSLIDPNSKSTIRTIISKKSRKVPVNPIAVDSSEGQPFKEKKYYIPSVYHHQSTVEPHHFNNNNIYKFRGTAEPHRPMRPDEQVKTTLINDYLSAVITISNKNDNTSSIIPTNDQEKYRISSTTTTTTRSSLMSTSLDEVLKSKQTENNQSIHVDDNNSNSSSSSNEIPRHRSASIVQQQQQQQQQQQRFRVKTKDADGQSKIIISEREKEGITMKNRGTSETNYRAISSESPPRITKTTKSTAAPISKSATYYTDPDQSYPYYAIYDDDISIYKDDDYTQYTVNRTLQIPQQQQQQQQHVELEHQHQNLRIPEVNLNNYAQKPKKVTINDADKYNFNPEVTVSDYELYDNQPPRNKFRVSDGQHQLRTNGLGHSVVHITTPNAIIDTYEPLTTTTTTTQPPPSTTVRPYTVTLQNRGRGQINRGTAPSRLRPTLKPSTAIVSKAQEYVDIYRYPPVRPAPIYPTPSVDKPAAKCRKDVCLLPDCNCGGTDIPGGIGIEKLPQIVLMTFDDAVNDLNKQLYEDLFERDRKNPNGCPISATFYVSHEWTDYSQVQNLYADGHELASHTVSHSFGEQFSARKWAREVAGQREILAAYGGLKLEDVRGMRAPFLSVGGNNMFKMLWDMNFTYDSSMPIYENRPPSWPYTLDYKLFHDCMIPPCPTRSYPGLWEVPMVMWQDLNGGRCSMGDACSNPPTPDGVYKMLIKNFERHYTTNRAPFGLFYHAAWFTQPHHKEGFISFLDTIVAMDDVWIITNWQAIQWVRNPTPLQLLHRFEPFGCNYPDRPKKCNNPKVCNLWHKSGVRYMKTCQACPDIYPWTGKTGIRSSRIDNDLDNN